jgi:hypothetical protein
MIVNDFHRIGSILGPDEAHAILLVYPHTELPLPVTRQRLKTITWWDPQLLK